MTAFASGDRGASRLVARYDAPQPHRATAAARRSCSRCDRSRSIRRRSSSTSPGGVSAIATIAWDGDARSPSNGKRTVYRAARAPDRGRRVRRSTPDRLPRLLARSAGGPRAATSRRRAATRPARSATAIDAARRRRRATVGIVACRARRRRCAVGAGLGRGDVARRASSAPSPPRGARSSTASRFTVPPAGAAARRHAAHRRSRTS